MHCRSVCQEISATDWFVCESGDSYSKKLNFSGANSINMFVPVSSLFYQKCVKISLFELYNFLCEAILLWTWRLNLTVSWFCTIATLMQRVLYPHFPSCVLQAVRCLLSHLGASQNPVLILPWASHQCHRKEVGLQFISYIPLCFAYIRLMWICLPMHLLINNFSKAIMFPYQMKVINKNLHVTINTEKKDAFLQIGWFYQSAVQDPKNIYVHIEPWSMLHTWL